MKGIVFNVFEEVAASHYGDETWDARPDLEGIYTSVGPYPDAEQIDFVG
jgi:hypothetical protein